MPQQFMATEDVLNLLLFERDRLAWLLVELAEGRPQRVVRQAHLDRVRLREREGGSA